MLTLRFVISLWATVAVAVVAAITLSLTLTSSLGALRTIGHWHAAAILRCHSVQVEGFMERPARHLFSAMRLAAADTLVMPSDDPKAYGAWEAFGRSVYWDGNDEANADSGVIIAFRDGTLMNFYHTNATTSWFQTVAVTPPYSDPRWHESNFTSNSTATYLERANRTVIARVSEVVDTTDLRNLFFQVAPLLMAGARRGIPVAMPVAAMELGGSNGAVFAGSEVARPRLVLPVAAPLFGRDQPASDTMSGLIFIAYAIERIDDFLREVRWTPNTAAFAVDGTDIVAASSLGRYSSVALRGGVATEGVDTSGTNCATSQLLGAAFADTHETIVCRAKRTEYFFAPLRDLSYDFVHLSGTEGQVINGRFDGELYYVAAARVQLQLHGVQLSLVVALPEADVIGDVVSSRNLAIAVTCATLLVVCVLTAGFVWVVLRPLKSVASRMVLAAELHDNGPGAGHTPSWLDEIADLETAYEALSTELRRIRSFVPDSVRVAAWGPSDSAGFTSLNGAMSAKEDHVAEERDATVSPGVVSAGGFAMELEARSSQDQASAAYGLRRGGSDAWTHRSLWSRSSRGTAARQGRPGQEAAVVGAPRAGSLLLALEGYSVTVVAVNASGFLAATSKHSQAAIVEHIGGFVDAAVTVVKDCGGVVASFHGDHLVATFNASTRNAMHARRGATAAVQLSTTLPTLGLGLPVRVGVASGRALVGNVGGADVKCFSTIGPAFGQALLLERMCRHYGVSVLATRYVCQSVAAGLHCRYVDLLQLPGSPGRVHLLGALAANTPPRATGSNSRGGGMPADAVGCEWGFLVGGSADASLAPGGAHGALALTSTDLDNGMYEALWAGDVGTAVALNAQRIALDDAPPEPTLDGSHLSSATAASSQNGMRQLHTNKSSAGNNSPIPIAKPALPGLLRRAVRNAKRGRAGIVCTNLGTLYAELFGVHRDLATAASGGATPAGGGGGADRLLPDEVGGDSSLSTTMLSNATVGDDDDATSFIAGARGR